MLGVMVMVIVSLMARQFPLPVVVRISMAVPAVCSDMDGV